MNGAVAPINERVTQAVFRAIRDVNQARPKAQQIPAAADTALLGEGAVLDSLGLVNLIVAIEEQVADEFGTTIAIADEKARLQPETPFRTVGTLVAYIVSLLEAQPR